MFGIDKDIKKAVKEYELELIKQEKLKSRTLSKNMDYAYLEKCVKESSDNNVKVTIQLKDGTKLIIEPTAPKRPHTDIIDGYELY